MSWVLRGVSYCRQLASRLSLKTVPGKQVDTPVLSVNNTSALCASVRFKTEVPPYKFPAKSPYKNPGPRKFGYQQKFFDGGRLPRGLSKPVESLEKYRPRNVWNRERATFGQNDYIGFNGNEMQRLVRRMRGEGHIIRQLYPTHYKNHWKRIFFLYKKYNQRRGKRV